MSDQRPNAFGQPSEDHYTTHGPRPYLTGDVSWDTRSGFKGKGPKGYIRSDDRLREDICEKLTDDAFIDASNIDVIISNAEVTLNGTVHSKEEKRRAEDLIDDIIGVNHVMNNLRVLSPEERSRGTAGPGT